MPSESAYLGFIVSINDELTRMQFGRETNDGDMTEFITDSLWHCRHDIILTAPTAE